MDGADAPARVLPRTSQVPHPSTRYLDSPVRALSRALIRRRFDLHLHGTEHVPVDGPVIVASNHVGIIDGPLLAIVGPRPVHALTKGEMFRGRTGRFLTAAGQIPVDRHHPDPAAIKASLRVLRDGHALGIFPEGARGDGELGRFHRGVGYLALVSGAPVVPVALFGTREPGGGTSSLPAPGSRIDVVYGAAYRLDPRPWPRTREQVAEATALLRGHLLAHLALSKTLTGRSLPGPLPPGDHERELHRDPATGITDQGA